MERNQLLHDPRSLAFRTPFGAAKAGETVLLRLNCPPSVHAVLRLWEESAAYTGERLVQGERGGAGMEFCFVPEHTGLVWYYFVLEENGSRKYYGGGNGPGALFSQEPPSWQITVYGEGCESPAWFDQGIAYQIFPDRFFRGAKQSLEASAAYHTRLGRRVVLHQSWEEPVNYLPLPGETDYDPCDFYGGDLIGVREKLPYLAELGVTCLYLNPVFESCSNHRYDTANYLSVDPLLGGDEALASLAREAKRYGMRLMLDGVFSHTGADSVYFDRCGRYGGGAYSNPDSPYRNWYDFEEYPDKYKAWWGFRSLPEIRENEPTYRAFIASVLARYAKMGITSWRLDVADELPDDFIAFLRKTLHDIDPQGVLLGEVWEDASSKVSMGGRRQYAQGQELHSAMGYPFREAVLGFLCGRLDAAALSDRLWALRMNYPKPFYDAQLNLLGSHDTVRALTVLSGAPDRDALTRERQARYDPGETALALGRARLRLAMALQFSLPGVPCIYYGDEAGMSGMADPFNRGTFPWGKEDVSLLDFVRDLAALRKSRAALQSGGCAFAALCADVFAVLRAKDGARVLTLVNRSDAQQSFALYAEAFHLGPDAEQMRLDGQWRDGFTGLAATDVQPGKTVSLPPRGLRVLLCEE